jgi:L-ascorbate metabolism protein UlaG (beta-lactamase superfamily)
VQLTRFGHSCVRLDEDARGIVVDPGTFSDAAAALAGASAVLVTHEHTDHLDGDAVRGALRADPGLRVFGPQPVADMLADVGDQVTALEPGASLDVAGFPVRTFGGQHALIHLAIPIVANLAYLVGEAVYHPGDSFTVPPAAVHTLLVPTAAPWSKAAEVIDFAVAVRAPQAFQIHDALVTDAYASIVEGHLDRIASPFGVTFEHLAAGETVEV